MTKIQIEKEMKFIKTKLRCMSNFDTNSARETSLDLRAELQALATMWASLA